MKIIATGFGDPQMLRAVPAESPPPRRGEVSIQVRAAGVNHRDYKVYNDPDYATSRGGDAPGFPLDLGVEAAGVVTAGAYEIAVSDSFPLTEAAAAHELLARGDAAGLVVLVAEEPAQA